MTSTPFLCASSLNRCCRLWPVLVVFRLLRVWSSWAVYWLWLMVDFSYTHMLVASKANLLVKLANNPKAVTFDQ